MQEERRFCLNQMEQSVEFVESHWTDSWGQQCAAWYRYAKNDLSGIEQSTDGWAETLNQITRLCQEALDSISGNPDAQQKVYMSEEYRNAMYGNNAPGNAAYGSMSYGSADYGSDSYEDEAQIGGRHR